MQFQLCIFLIAGFAYLLPCTISSSCIFSPNPQVPAVEDKRMFVTQDPQMDRTELVTLCTQALDSLRTLYLSGQALPLLPGFKLPASPASLGSFMDLDIGDYESFVRDLVVKPHLTEPSFSPSQSSLQGISLMKDPLKMQLPPEAMYTALPAALRSFLKSSAALKLGREAIDKIEICSRLLLPSTQFTGVSAAEGSSAVTAAGLNALHLSPDIDFGMHRAVDVDLEELHKLAGGVKLGQASVLELLHLTGSLVKPSVSTTGIAATNQHPPAEAASIQGVQEHVNTVEDANSSIDKDSQHQSALMFKTMTFSFAHVNPMGVGEGVWLFGAAASPAKPHTFAVLDPARLTWHEGKNVLLVVFSRKIPSISPVVFFNVLRSLAVGHY